MSRDESRFESLPCGTVAIRDAGRGKPRPYRELDKRGEERKRWRGHKRFWTSSCLPGHGPFVPQGKREGTRYLGSLAYSDLAACRAGMLGSASFQRAKKS